MEVIKKHNEDDRFLKSLGSMLSHELKTPLATIVASGGIVREDVEKLINGYRVALQANIDIPAFNDKQLEALLKFMDNIANEARTANFFVYLISSILKAEGRDALIEEFDLKQAAEQAILKVQNEYIYYGKNIKIVNNIETSESIKTYKEAAIAVFCCIIYNSIQRAPLNHETEIHISATREDIPRGIDILQNRFEDLDQSIAAEVRKLDCCQYNKNIVSIKDNISTYENEEKIYLKPELYYCKKYMEKIKGSFEISKTEDSKRLHKLVFRS